MPSGALDIVSVMRTLKGRSEEGARRTSGPVDPDTFHRAFQAFYGAVARQPGKPASSGSASSRRKKAKGARTIPTPPAIVLSLSAAYETLLQAGVAHQPSYLIRLIALDAMLGGADWHDLELFERMTELSVGEEALARAAAVAPLFRTEGRAFFATDDLVRNEGQA